MSEYNARLICDRSEFISPTEIFSITLACTLLFTTIVLGTKSIQSMVASKTHRSLKYLFISSILALCFYLIACILINTICQIHSDRQAMIPMTFAILSYYIMAVNLLGSLLLRLYIIFDGSMYTIPQLTRYILNHYFITIILMFQPSIYRNTIKIKYGSEKVSLTIYFASSGFLFYFLLICVALFAKNMQN